MFFFYDHFCKTSVSEMTAKIRISVLLGEILDIFVSKKYQNNIVVWLELTSRLCRNEFFERKFAARGNSFTENDWDCSQQHFDTS